MGAHPVILTMPVIENDALAGVIDLIKMVYITFGGRLGGEVQIQDIPEQYQQAAEIAAIL